MKKVILSLLVFFSAGALKAAWFDDGLINQASYTATGETLALIRNTLPGTLLVGVVIATSSGVNLLIYDSSRTATNQIGKIILGGNTDGSDYIPFNIRVSSGITYTIANNNPGITFIYKITRP